MGNTGPWVRLPGHISTVHSLSQDPWRPAWSPPALRTLVARLASDPSAAQTSIRQAIRRVDETMAFSQSALADRFGLTVALPRLAAGLLGLFGSIGVLLSALGIYALVARWLGQRTREFGLRFAIGDPAPRHPSASVHADAGGNCGWHRARTGRRSRDDQGPGGHPVRCEDHGWSDIRGGVVVLPLCRASGNSSTGSTRVTPRPDGGIAKRIVV